MATFRAPSVVPGAIDAFTASYDRGIAATTAARQAAINEALAMERLQETSDLGAARRALPGDIAAVSAARFGAPAPLAPPGPSVVPPIDMAGMPEQLAGPAPEIAPAGVAGAIAPTASTSLAPAELGTPGGDDGGVTLGMLAGHPGVGADRLARMMRTPEGQVALKSKGYVTEEEFAKRQQRREAKKQAAAKYREAEQLYRSGTTADVVQAMNVEAAAHTLLAQAVDNPERLLAKADDLRKKVLEASEKKDEREKVGRDFPKLLGAVHAWTQAMNDPTADQAAASTAFFEAAGAMESKAGQHRADDFIKKVSEGLIDRAKKTPIAAFNRAIAATIEERRDKGGSMRLDGVFEAAARRDPAGYAQFLEYVMTAGKDIPKPLLSLLGLGDVPSDPVHLADNLVVQVEGIPRGSARYYTRLREVTREITHEQKPQFATEDRKARSLERDADVRLHKQLQDQVKDAQRAIKDAGGPELATPEQNDELATSRERLRAHESAMVDKKTLSPGVRDAKPATPKVTPPPKAPTADDVTKEAQRLMAPPYSLSQDKTREAMRAAGWPLK